MNTRVDPLASLAQFEPKAPAKEKQDTTHLDQLAHEHGFTSRVAAPAPSAAPVGRVERSKRRFKTGRNEQINVKGTAEAKARFYRLADELDVPLGEFLELAMDALEEKMRAGK